MASGVNQGENLAGATAPRVIDSTAQDAYATKVCLMAGAGFFLGVLTLAGGLGASDIISTVIGSVLMGGSPTAGILACCFWKPQGAQQQVGSAELLCAGNDDDAEAQTI